MRLPALAAVCVAAAASALAGPSASGPDQPHTVVRVHTVGRAVDHLGRSLTEARPGQRRVSLGVVFDSTGSMYDDLRQLIRGVEEVLQLVVAADTHIIENFILVPYHDPGQASRLVMLFPVVLFVLVEYTRTRCCGLLSC